MIRAALVAVALVAGTVSVSAATLAEMQERAAFVATRYLEIWSSNDGTPIAGVPFMYGPTVMFYGRPYTQPQLVAEKRRAIRQWPVRRYAHRPGTLRVICNSTTQKCAARSIIDFTAANPRLGTIKRGSARFDLGISFAAARPRILYEGGSLGARRVNARS